MVKQVSAVARTAVNKAIGTIKTALKFAVKSGGRHMAAAAAGWGSSQEGPKRTLAAETKKQQLATLLGSQRGTSCGTSSTMSVKSMPRDRVMRRPSKSTFSLLTTAPSSAINTTLKRANSNIGEDISGKRRPRKASFSRQMSDDVEGAVSEALAMHESLLQILRDNTRRKGGSWNKGAEAAGEAAGEMYWDCLRVFNKLLPAASMGAPSIHEADGVRYSVYEFRGEEVGKRMGMSQKLAKLRKRGLSERATEALLVVLSCMGSRKEMCWIEDFEDEKPIRGHFAHALADPRTSLRLSCVHIGDRVFPASLIMAEHIPMREALDGFDNDGPLKEAPKRLGSDFELAFQPLLADSTSTSQDSNMADERQALCDVVAHPQLTRTVVANSPVMMVDSYLALAPKEVCSQQGLSKVVGAELAEVLRRAKADATPVILQLGGEEAHTLARKVYMKPKFAAHGLRCGYIRWRSGGKTSWGKEQSSDDRCCLALQLP